MARHWFRGRFQASALPLVEPWAVLRSARLPEGPGSLARHWFRGRLQASALPLVKLWAVLRSERHPEGPGSLGGLGPAAVSVREASVWR